MTTSALAADFLRFLPAEAVVTPDNAEYDGLRRVWNGMIDRLPLVILRPRNVAEVSRCVSVAATTGVPLSVRGGGHSFPGFSTCDKGIVLDLSRLNAILADPAVSTVNVEGGALLGDVDRATAVYGMVVPAGVVSHTGAGGLTLGGGMGYTSRRFGMTVDNLLGVEMVMADGRIIEVDAASDPELFWGLRGGGGNFGVVTKFRFRMHPLGSVTVGQWSYPPERCAEALVRLGEIAVDAPLELSVTLSAAASGLYVKAVHSGNEGDGEALVGRYSELAGQGEGGVSHPDFVQLQSIGDEATRWGRRYYGRGGFIGPITPAFAETVAECTATTPTDDSEIYMIQLGGAVSDVAEDATAYSGRSAGFYWLAQPIWDDPSEDAVCLAWGRQYGAALAAQSQAGNYVNEQGETGRDTVMQAYGLAKYARLSKLKARVDPKNLFRLNQNIVPSDGAFGKCNDVAETAAVARGRAARGS